MYVGFDILYEASELNILFILPELPYPLITGVRVKCHSILLAASNCHSCDIVSLGGEDTTTGASLIAEYVPKGRLLSIFSPYKGWRLILAKFWSLLKCEPIFFARFSNSRVRASVCSLQAEGGYDLVFVESFALAGYGVDLINSSSVISITDALSLTYSHAAEESNSFLFGLYRWYQLGLVKKAESLLLPKYTATHVVAEFDRAHLLKNNIGLDVFAISHVVPDQVVNNFKKHKHLVVEKKSKKNILYTGRCDSDTALNALSNFVDQVFKPLIDSGLDLELTILPGGAKKRVIEVLLNLDKIVVKDWVENYELELLNSDILVFLDSFQCGVKTRVLYALAAGKSIVATPESTYGLPVVDGEHLLIAKLGPQFVSAVQLLVDDEPLARSLGASAINLIEERLSANVHNRKWNDAFSRYRNKLPSSI